MPIEKCGDFLLIFRLLMKNGSRLLIPALAMASVVNLTFVNQICFVTPGLRRGGL